MSTEYVEPLTVAWKPGDPLLHDGWHNGHVQRQIELGVYPYARGKWEHLVNIGKIDKSNLEAYDKAYKKANPKPKPEPKIEAEPTEASKSSSKAPKGGKKK